MSSGSYDYPQQSKDELVDSRKTNLPLPEEPPTGSDFSSANQKTVNVGSGGDNAQNPELSHSGGIGTGPATGVSEARVAGDEYKQNTGGLDTVGRQRVENLDGLPSDAVAGKKQDTQGVEGTKQPDYGYPHNSDPAGSFDQTRNQG